MIPKSGLPVFGKDHAQTKPKLAPGLHDVSQRTKFKGVPTPVSGCQDSHSLSGIWGRNSRGKRGAAAIFVIARLVPAIHALVGITGLDSALVADRSRVTIGLSTASSPKTPEPH